MHPTCRTVPERSERAMAAGCDIVLNCWAKMDDMQGICERLPTISDAASARLDRALSGTRVADGVSEEASDLLAKRDELLALAGEPV